jgi:hypothetical protein
MTYTPVELRHVRVGHSLFGYNRATVEQLIEEVAQSFEVTWRERGELADRVEALERQLEEHKQREHLLSQTLIAAEQAASIVRERARREADAIVSEAHIESRAIGRQAQAEREHLLAETQRIKAMLRSALGIISEGTEGLEPASAPARPPARREGPVVLPPVRDDPPRAAADEDAVEHDPREEVPAVLPPVLVDSPLEAALPDGWREDTREFEALGPDELEPSADELEDEPSATPVLPRIPGRESRDFDWGD